MLLRFDLQGGVECGFEHPQIFDPPWQIVRTEFFTDVSLRVKRMDGSSPTEFDWRVLIRRGSWVEWPILKNGCVIAPCSGLP